MKTIYILFTVFIITAVLSCNNVNEKEKTVFINTDSIKGQIIADTIIYDVLINNPNPEDTWKNQCLQYLDKTTFIENIFQSIYNEKLKAYHFQTGEEFSLSYIKSIEQEDWFSREGIGKVQFQEIWFMNTEHQVLEKKVLSLVLGVEQFTPKGELKGYKPLFRVHYN